MQVQQTDLSIMVKAEWDNEADVWVATSDDVPGLVTEHADFRKLQEMVLELVPVLLVENDMLPHPHRAQNVPVHIAAHALASGRAVVPA